MARQVRIEYPGAFYHVFSRGNQKQDTFRADDDRLFFFNCVREACERFDATIHSYCLMPNHYHLFIETRSANLSRIMHMINTAYSIYFNTKHDQCGHLFQGRYKAVLVQADVYARELSRYIHLNPVRNGMVSSPDGYVWSSYQEYLGIRKPPPWLNIRFTLDLFGRPPANAQRYARFVEEGISADPEPTLRESQALGILGDHDFIEGVTSGILKDQLTRPDRERPQLGKLIAPPDPGMIVALAQNHFGPHNRHVKSAAIFMMRAYTRMTFKEIAAHFQMSLSGVSNAFRRMKLELQNNETIYGAFKRMELEFRMLEQKRGQIYLLSESNKR